MLVLSLMGVNFGFWARLGCSGLNTITFSRKGLFQGCTRRNIEKLSIVNSFYLLDSCNQNLKSSPLGVKKRLDHAQIGLLQGFHSKFPTSIPSPFTCAVPSGPFVYKPEKRWSFGRSLPVEAGAHKQLWAPPSRKGPIQGVSPRLTNNPEEISASVAILFENSTSRNNNQDTYV